MFQVRAAQYNTEALIAANLGGMRLKRLYRVASCKLEVRLAGQLECLRFCRNIDLVAPVVKLVW